MHFVDLIKEECSKNSIKRFAMFVDMDGVLADLKVGDGRAIRNKIKGMFLAQRPVMNTINIFKELKNVPNLDLFILSACYDIEQSKNKSRWLDQHAPFFDHNKRYFVIREVDNYPEEDKMDVKGKYIKRIIEEQNYDFAYFIDDTYQMLQSAQDLLQDKIKCFYISSIID